MSITKETRPQPQILHRQKKHLPLPEDVVFEILVTLPVKSLLRFRCVCKSWHSYITNPNFISTRYLNNLCCNHGYVIHVPKNKTRALDSQVCTVSCDRTLKKISEFRIPFTFESGYAYLVGSCNGLLCLTDSLRYSLGNNAIYLWNPSIRKYKRLPGTCLSYSDCFELGFAYDFQNNDYKVVRISQSSSKGMPPLQFEVYTLRLDSWKRVGLGILWRLNVLSYNFKCYFSCSFVSGHLHWMLDIFEEVGGQPKPSEMILSFDVNSEKFKELPLPKDDSFILGGFETCLTMFKGKLALIQFGLVQQYGPHVMQCWVMRECGLPESWNKFCVVLVESPTNFVGFTKYGSLLFQTKSEPKKEDKFVLVDPKTQYKKDNIHLKYPLEVTLLNLATYMENITLLDEANVVSY